MTKPTAPGNDTCAHCGSSRDVVAKMVQLTSGALVCGMCVSDMHACMEGSDTVAKPVVTPTAGRLTPRAIVSFLDGYVIGQKEAKQSLAIAVYNHYKRLDSKCDVELFKSNVLMLGPTGTGKTLLAQTVAKLLDVPFTIADATSLTQAGYVGDDVETILQRLLQAADGDIEKAQRGIVFVDEIDKLAKADIGSSLSKDVSGEGVQQALLKLIEGTRVSVQVTGNRKTPGGAVNYIDTTNILFVCAGAFSSLLDSLHTPVQRQSIGFVQETAKQAPATEVTPEMLFKFGLIPEFVGRLPVITTLEPLTAEDLERILVEPKNAVVRQMAALLSMDQAELVLAEGAVKAVAEKSIKLKTGARGARGVLEQLLKPAMLEVPDQPGSTVTIQADLTVSITAGTDKSANEDQVKLAA